MYIIHLRIMINISLIWLKLSPTRCHVLVSQVFIICNVTTTLYWKRHARLAKKRFLPIAIWLSLSNIPESICEDLRLHLAIWKIYTHLNERASQTVLTRKWLFIQYLCKNIVIFFKKTNLNLEKAVRFYFILKQFINDSPTLFSVIREVPLRLVRNFTDFDGTMSQ